MQSSVKLRKEINRKANKRKNSISHFYFFIFFIRRQRTGQRQKRCATERELGKM